MRDAEDANSIAGARRRSRWAWAQRWAGAAAWFLAVAGPVALTAVLVGFGAKNQRDYVFLYLALVVVLGFRGLWQALTCAGLSFLLVDYFFVPPVGTLTIADEQDLVNLVAFIATAGVIGFLTDRRRRAQVAAEKLTRQMEDVNAELVRLNREQAEAAQAAVRLARTEQQVRALREAEQVRQELLANVSHELRTPLATILTESTAMLAEERAPEPQRRLGTIASEARRLSGLVDDLLDMARIEGGALELHLEPVQLADALVAAGDRLRSRSPQRRLEWEAEAAGVEVLADWDRLGQILDNLLANADRFGPPGTPIEIGIEKPGQGLVGVTVSDRGPGVPEQLRDHIFERFVRGDHADAGESGGTGLGLAIARGLVEAHAGTIALEPSAGNGGARFRFTLPLAEAE